MQNLDVNRIRLQILFLKFIKINIKKIKKVLKCQTNNLTAGKK